MNANEVRLSLSDEDVIKIFNRLGITNYKEDDKSIQFPTVCHNADSDNASLKLYYYRDTKLFHCYTDCGDTFNIFEMIRRFYEARGISKSFYEIFSFVTNEIEVNDDTFDFFVYTKQERKQKTPVIELPAYSSHILDVFSKQYCSEWLQEGIKPDTMDKYNIRYSISQNKIIIPHYDLNNRLIGIRGRALNPEDIIGGKYKPIFIEGKMYNHPLSLNLYGLNFNIEEIKKTKTVILFESEKSVLLLDSFLGTSNGVAVCGSNFNKNQLLILLRNVQVANIIIAFDKEYEKYGSQESEKYIAKLRSIGQKYGKYCNFYYIADKENLLGYKDSPIDKGIDVFNYLLSKKMLIRS